MSKKFLLLCMMSLFILTAVFTGCGDQKKDAASGEKVLRVGCNADLNSKVKTVKNILVLIWI